MKLKCKIKPLLVESIQYTGTNYQEIQKFIPSHVFQLQDCLLIANGFRNDIIVNVDDFIIKDNQGNIFRCTPEQFHQRYEVIVN